MIVSFAWTTPALLAGAKTCTRRQWSPSHARKIQDGQLVDAWDRLPRVKGARKVATIRITAAPELQSTAQIPDSDWQAEGFDWLTRFGTDDDARIAHAIWDAWRAKAQILYVVRFELERLVDARRSS
jgi:hypothetical protein